MFRKIEIAKHSVEVTAADITLRSCASASVSCGMFRVRGDGSNGEAAAAEEAGEVATGANKNDAICCCCCCCCEASGDNASTACC